MVLKNTYKHEDSAVEGSISFHVWLFTFNRVMTWGRKTSLFNVWVLKKDHKSLKSWKAGIRSGPFIISDSLTALLCCTLEIYNFSVRLTCSPGSPGGPGSPSSPLLPGNPCVPAGPACPLFPLTAADKTSPTRTRDTMIWYCGLSHLNLVSVSCSYLYQYCKGSCTNPFGLTLALLQEGCATFPHFRCLCFDL